MSSTSTLPISTLINVQVLLAPVAAQVQNLSTLLIIGNSYSPAINVSNRYKLYTSLTQVAVDFATTSPEYLAATLWFEQSPQPVALWIGYTPTSGSQAILVGGAISLANQAIAVWNAITNGGFAFITNTATTHLKNLNFSGATNLYGVAGVINAALNTALATSNVVYCSWSASTNNFIFNSGNNVGAVATLDYLGIGISGSTNIATMLAGTSAAGATKINGVAAETPLQAVTIFDNLFGQGWYAVTLVSTAGAISDANWLAVAGFIEASTTKHLLGVSTQEIGVITTGDSSSIAYQLSQLGYNHTVVQYNSTNPYSVVSYLARLITVNYGGQNTTITMAYKQEPGITPDNLSATQLAAAEAENCNVFVEFNNNTAIVLNGVNSSGQYSDTITGLDWFAVTLQTALYNALYTSTTKVPQTDAGMDYLGNVIIGVCEQAYNNGLIGPGTWTSGGFGSLVQNQFLPRGYYLYTPPVASQSQATRATRVSVPFQIALKLAGAVQSVDVIVSVNS